MNLTYENYITLLTLVNNRMTKLEELAKFDGPVKMDCAIAPTYSILLLFFFGGKLLAALSGMAVFFDEAIDHEEDAEERKNRYTDLVQIKHQAEHGEPPLRITLFSRGVQEDNGHYEKNDVGKHKQFQNKGHGGPNVIKLGIGRK